MQIFKKTGLCVIAIIVLCGICSAKEAGYEPAEILTVHIKKGDTLISICDRLLKEPEKWPEVARMNDLPDPNTVYPKDKINLPAGMLMPDIFIGRVKFVKGDVQAIIPEGEKIWQPLYLKDRVWRGSSIKTGKDSLLVVENEEQASFVVSSNSNLKISAFDQEEENKSLNVFLKLGRLLSSVKFKTEVRTPTAVAGIRGTDFRVSVDTDDATRTEVLSGSVAVTGMAYEVTVNKGEGTYVKKNTPPISPVPIMNPPVLKRLSSFTFQCDNADGADSYRMILARDEQIHEQVKESIIKPDEIFDITGSDDGAYYIQASAIDQYGLEGFPSEPEKIIVSDPMPPIVQVPSNREKYQNVMEFRWVKSKGCVKYHLQVAEDAEFQTLREDTIMIWPYLDNIPQMDQVCSTYREGYELKTYYFRIAAIDRQGREGLWSDIRTFNFTPRFTGISE
jgi:hypothetical protein